jgi:hypothetical protein
MPRVTKFRQVTVGTDMIQIVPYQPGRSGVLIKNYSGSQVFISTDAGSVLTTGYPLATGDYISLISTDGDAAELQIYAQCPSDTADLRIVESYGELR